MTRTRRAERPTGDDAAPAEALPPGVVDALARPSAYPHDPTAPAGVERVQTHISFVYLTPAQVYKLRKSVDLGFVCFATRAERNADCLREVALNRRLAPDVYLGVAPIELEGGAARVGPVREELARDGGRPPEHVVVMRRLPQGRDALALCAQGRLRARHVDAIAALVARFHESHRLRGARRPALDAWLARCTEPARDNFELLEADAREHLPRATLARARRLSEAFAREHAGRFEARWRDGRGVDGHGDLHLQHAWFEHDDAPPLLIDCLEFRDDLRCIDAAADIAFLSMDLRYRGRHRLAERFLRRYARDTDDFDLYRVVDYFESYRAAVRAKVAALAAGEEEIDAEQRTRAGESARRHLRLAARALEPRGGAVLVIVCGVVGTGKSTAAEVAADVLGGAVVASDRVRKRLAGLQPTERPSQPGALYGAEQKDRTYAGLLERARPVLESGRAAVLDATYARRAHRQAARRLAGALGAPVLLIETRCRAEVARDRLARRRRRDRDPSDAGPEYYEKSVRGFEPPDEWKAPEHVVARTDAPGWRAALGAALRRARARGR